MTPSSLCLLAVHVGIYMLFHGLSHVVDDTLLACNYTGDIYITRRLPSQQIMNHCHHYDHHHSQQRVRVYERVHMRMRLRLRTPNKLTKISYISLLTITLIICMIPLTLSLSVSSPSSSSSSSSSSSPVSHGKRTKMPSRASHSSGSGSNSAIINDSRFVVFSRPVFIGLGNYMNHSHYIIALPPLLLYMMPCNVMLCYV
jgi:hypothetical protein